MEEEEGKEEQKQHDKKETAFLRLDLASTFRRRESNVHLSSRRWIRIQQKGPSCKWSKRIYH
jgi:hypothetical protein